VGKAGPLIENTSWWAEKPLTRRCPRREGLKELIKTLSHLHKALQQWGLFCLLGIKDHRGALSNLTYTKPLTLCLHLIHTLKNFIQELPVPTDF